MSWPPRVKLCMLKTTVTKGRVGAWLLLGDLLSVIEDNAMCNGQGAKCHLVGTASTTILFSFSGQSVAPTMCQQTVSPRPSIWGKGASAGWELPWTQWSSQRNVDVLSVSHREWWVCFQNDSSGWRDVGNLFQIMCSHGWIRCSLGQI